MLHNKQVNKEWRSGTLNVVFHGMWVFVPRPYGLEVVAPKVSGHAYRAGTWCAEQDLSSGEFYYLDGVKPNDSTVTVSGNSNVLLPGPLAKDYQSNVFCTWMLPRPSTFHSIRRIQVGPQWFTGPDTNRQYVEHLKELALVQVLCYPFDEHSSPSIRQLSRCGAELPWDKEFDAKTKTVNLHVSAEEPLRLAGEWMNDLHPTLAFGAFAKLIDLDLGFRYPSKWEPPTALPESGVAGVPIVQVSSQTERPASISGVSQFDIDFAAHAEKNCLGGFVHYGPPRDPGPRFPGETYQFVFTD